MLLTLTLLAAIALDYCLGELDNAYHPLVAFGRWVTFLENVFLNLEQSSFRQSAFGVMAVFCVLSPCLLFPIYWLLPSVWQTLLGIAILYFCIGARSLQQHAHAVYMALQQNDIVLARQRVADIVSRQTDGMNEGDVRRAAIESVLENGADAVFAPLFWFIVLGPFGALLYRLTNTLDAMWGYKNQRYLHFGWAAARLDDGLNWLPARLTALAYVLIGNTQQGLRAWSQQADLLDSPNAGPVMTAGAGALNIRLGGPAIYHGKVKNKPWFGGNAWPKDADINLAVRLIVRTLALWLLIVGFVEYVV